MDFNHDGKKDLLTGENSGNIRFYENVGTDSAPVFNGYTFIMVNGVKFDSGSYSWIHVTDWNNDGMWDILSGETSGRIYLLLNEGTPYVADFKKALFLQEGFKTIDVGSRSSPTVTDLDRDGKKDLISGSSAGNIFFFKNMGSDASPVFVSSTLLKADGVTIDVGYDAHPDVVDWDNDGVMDIITGEFYGNILIYRAIGPLSINRNALSVSAPAKIAFDLNCGATYGNRYYLIFGGVSGTSPGTPLPGGYVTLPINWDLFTNMTLIYANTPLFVNFMGQLSASGEASATMALGGIPSSAIGIHMVFAYALGDPWDYASNPPMVEIIP